MAAELHWHENDNLICMKYLKTNQQKNVNIIDSHCQIL